MKKTNLIYWISTALFGGLMLFSAIPDILNVPEAVTFMTSLGYPPYFTPFIGLAKLLGVIAILVPGFPRLKEWAYAGLVFDLIGAVYSQIALGMVSGGMVFMLLFFVLAFLSYFYHHKRLKEKSTS